MHVFVDVCMFVCACVCACVGVRVRVRVCMSMWEDVFDFPYVWLCVGYDNVRPPYTFKFYLTTSWQHV